MCELLAVREHGHDVYDVALSDLRAKGLVAGGDERALLATAGKELRAELEATTEHSHGAIGAHRVPGIRSPIYLAVVPVHPPAVARFLIAEQFRTVRFINIVPLS